MLPKCSSPILLLALLFAQHAIAQHSPFSTHRHSLRKRFGTTSDAYESRANIVTPLLQLGYIGGLPALKPALQFEHYLAGKRRWSYIITAAHFEARQLKGAHNRSVNRYATLSANYIAPGFALHLKTANKEMDPSFGISFPLGRMTRTESIDSPGYDASLRRQAFFGVVCGTFSLSATTRKRVVFGCVLNAGLIYRDAPAGDISPRKDKAFVTIGYKMGWRFGKKIDW